jgi:hypothetical protein
VLVDDTPRPAIMGILTAAGGPPADLPQTSLLPCVTAARYLGQL